MYLTCLSVNDALAEREWLYPQDNNPMHAKPSTRIRLALMPFLDFDAFLTVLT